MHQEDLAALAGEAVQQCCQPLRGRPHGIVANPVLEEIPQQEERAARCWRGLQACGQLGQEALDQCRMAVVQVHVRGEQHPVGIGQAGQGGAGHGLLNPLDRFDDHRLTRHVGMHAGAGGLHLGDLYLQLAAQRWRHAQKLAPSPVRATRLKALETLLEPSTDRSSGEASRSVTRPAESAVRHAPAGESTTPRRSSPTE